MKKTIVMMAALMLTAGGMVYAQQPEKQDTPQKENPTAPEQKQEPTAPEEKPDPVKPEQTPAAVSYTHLRAHETGLPQSRNRSPPSKNRSR